MRAFVSKFWTSKAGTSALDYEDASAVEPAADTDGQFTGKHLSAAVADGASEAMLAQQWATTLVQSFVAAPPATGMLDVLTGAVAGWENQLERYRAEREHAEKPIEWWEEPGIERGSYATVVGARFTDSSKSRGQRGRFDAWALGDACLFQVRDDEVIVAFPIDDPATFGASPALVPSRPPDMSMVEKHLVHLSGDWRAGDLLLMCTDALALWFLQQAADGGKPWHVLRDLGTDGGPGNFHTWVDERRASGELRNDDTTLLRLDIG